MNWLSSGYGRQAVSEIAGFVQGIRTLHEGLFAGVTLKPRSPDSETPRGRFRNPDGRTRCGAAVGSGWTGAVDNFKLGVNETPNRGAPNRGARCLQRSPG